MLNAGSGQHVWQGTEPSMVKFQKTKGERSLDRSYTQALFHIQARGSRLEDVLYHCWLCDITNIIYFFYLETLLTL